MIAIAIGDRNLTTGAEGRRARGHARHHRDRCHQDGPGAFSTRFNDCRHAVNARGKGYLEVRSIFYPLRSARRSSN